MSRESLTKRLTTYFTYLLFDLILKRVDHDVTRLIGGCWCEIVHRRVRGYFLGGDVIDFGTSIFAPFSYSEIDEVLVVFVLHGDQECIQSDCKAWSSFYLFIYLRGTLWIESAAIQVMF